MSEVSKIIDTIIGRPFQLRADGPAAFDCWGVVRHLTRAILGHELPSIYGDACSKGIAEVRDHYLELSGLGGLELGDVLHLGGLRGVSDQHVAFVQDRRHAITATSGVGVHRARVSQFRNYDIIAYRLKSRV